MDQVPNSARKADIFGLVLFSGLVAGMDALFVVRTRPDVVGDFLLLLVGLVGAGVGAAAAGRRGSVLRRWRLAAVGAVVAQAFAVAVLALMTVAVGSLFSGMHLVW
ncbi:hypothetical protein [Kitasatospora terrestris]|uniref:DUF1275 family protein n=1 Tax=Kitasatospora terrestris TaxID=258051 RepID=A0ABP9DB65_9ACTN